MQMNALLLAAAAARTAAAISTDPVILDLGSANFSEAVRPPGSRLLVSFYAPWCAHSQRFNREYEVAAKRLEGVREEDSTFVGRLARVDAMEEVALASSYGVRGYPTIYWFADGQHTLYQGARSADDVVDWVIKRGGPLIQALTYSTAEQAFRLSYDVSMVATLPDGASDALATFETVCRDLSAVRCGRRSGASEGQAARPSVVVYRAIDDAADPYPADLAFESAALRLFAVAHSLPPVLEYGYDTQAELFESSVNGRQ